jgi:hypothetical protein
MIVDKNLERRSAMGLNLLGTSGLEDLVNRTPAPLPNPDPANFRIVRVEVIGRFLVAGIHYPNCTNFEGSKILVFENMTEAQLRALTSIDPHFSERSFSPIARFSPTKKGWGYAELFCKSA